MSEFVTVRGMLKGNNGSIDAFKIDAINCTGVGATSGGPSARMWSHCVPLSGRMHSASWSRDVNTAELACQRSVVQFRIPKGKGREYCNASSIGLKSRESGGVPARSGARRHQNDLGRPPFAALLAAVFRVSLLEEFSATWEAGCSPGAQNGVNCDCRRQVCPGLATIDPLPQST